MCYFQQYVEQFKLSGHKQNRKEVQKLTEEAKVAGRQIIQMQLLYNIIYTDSILDGKPDLPSSKKNYVTEPNFTDKWNMN